MSGEATLTPDDGSEEIVIGKGDKVGCQEPEVEGVPQNIGLYYQEEDLDKRPFHFRFSSTVVLPAHGK